MFFLYQIGIQVSTLVLKVAVIFSKKIRRFQEGRNELFSRLKDQLDPSASYIWMHAASLGEYEQGLPVLELLKANYPDKRIILTFFSPSGYDIKKDASPADIVSYLPLDTLSNARRFISCVRPSMALFIKYEVWPNFFRIMQVEGVPLFMISARFQKSQVFFRPYGGFMRKTLGYVRHFFVQNETSATLLNSIGLQNVTITGDTRFDRVSTIAEKEHSLLFMQHFKQGQFCLVAGSTWPQDEEILLRYINQAADSVKVVLVPHDIDPDSCEDLVKRIRKRAVRFSKLKMEEIHEYQVLVIDKVGLLTKIYSYADAAYVGGGFATGLHNTLEPAVFGIPVIIGPKYDAFQEAVDLVTLGGMFSIRRSSEFMELVESLQTDALIRQTAGRICASYVEKNKGASIHIMEGIRRLV